MDSKDSVNKGGNEQVDFAEADRDHSKVKKDHQSRGECESIFAHDAIHQQFQRILAPKVLYLPVFTKKDPDKVDLFSRRILDR